MPTRPGTLRRAVGVYDGFLDGLAALAACILFATAALVALDAVLQHAPFLPRVEGVIELTEYSLYAVTGAAAPWALRKGAQISVEIRVDAMPQGARDAARAIADAIGLSVALVLVYAGGLAAWKADAAGRLVFKTFVFPEVWLLIPLPIGAAILALEFALRLAGLRRRRPVSEPA